MGRENTQQFPFERITQIVQASELAKWKHQGLAHYDINCLMCNAPMRVTEKQLKRRFCGRSCLHASLAVVHRGASKKRHGQWVNCLACHECFWMKQSKIDVGKGKYCSRECYIKAHPLTLDPTRCNLYGKPRIYTLFDPYVDRLGRIFRFRSSYEIVLVEQYLDRMMLTWDYECQTFDVGDFTYTPDFWVVEEQRFIEVKGYLRENERQKIEKFRSIYPQVGYVLATSDVLRDEFGLDLSKRALTAINNRYKVRTYVRHQDRVKEAA